MENLSPKTSIDLKLAETCLKQTSGETIKKLQEEYYALRDILKYNPTTKEWFMNKKDSLSISQFLVAINGLDMSRPIVLLKNEYEKIMKKNECCVYATKLLTEINSR